MRNINCLGHKLNSRHILGLPNDYICEVCNIIMYFNESEVAFDYKNEPLMTCEEKQIKNILE